MKVLVGYTGFVGSNIYNQGVFDYVFNSKNIEEAYDLNPDLLIYAGIRAEKYLANSMPEKDMNQILIAEEIIKRIAPKKLVLISTIDVLDNPIKADEDTLINPLGLQPYGYNRYELECWVKKVFPDSLIVRLPALFGENLKKNFIYDYITRIPFMLSKQKYDELIKEEPELSSLYNKLNNGFYQCAKLEKEEQERIKNIFEKLNFSALNFTDSRSIYQFYPLKRLWSDIQIGLKYDIRILNLATEPIEVRELYRRLQGGDFVNELDGNPVKYDFRTKYSRLFNDNSDGYICSKQQILNEIYRFVNEYK